MELRHCPQRVAIGEIFARQVLRKVCRPGFGVG
jgi:hypothetical protein